MNNCPICTNSKLNKFLAVEDFCKSHEEFELIKCDSCGLVITNKPPAKDKIGEYYQFDDYISHSDTNKGIVNKIYHWVRNYSINQKINLINKVNNGKGYLLDIGCGTGYFLKEAKNNGWKIEGVEPDNGARALAEKNTNIKIVEELQTVNDNKADVITMWHVLEHVYDLNEYMQLINDKLKNNGTLIIAVPNHLSYDAKIYNKYWAAYDVPRHLYHFSQINMDKLLEKYGYKKKLIKPMLFDSVYVSMLSEKYKKRNNLIKAIIIGLWSNLKAIFTKEYSSLIYIYVKNN